MLGRVAAMLFADLVRLGDSVPTAGSSSRGRRQILDLSWGLNGRCQSCAETLAILPVAMNCVLSGHVFYRLRKPPTSSDSPRSLLRRDLNNTNMLRPLNRHNMFLRLTTLSLLNPFT